MAPLQINGQGSVLEGDISSQRLRLISIGISDDTFKPEIQTST
jgi:hypothetical protein